MLRVLGCITEQHDLRLVVLAALICVFACYTAFSLEARARASTDWYRQAWLAGAAFVTGSGVWATHFVAELAYKPGLPVAYDVGLTILSVIIAVGVAGIGLMIAVMGFAIAGGAVVGVAVIAMHYTGMAALRLPAVAHWDWNYVAASVVISVIFAALAVFAAHRRKDYFGKLMATSCLVLGIVGLHFTAMSAVSFTPDASVLIPAQAIEPNWLAVVISAVTVLIVALGLTGAVVDQHLARRTLLETARLRDYVVALEKAKADLEATTERLREASNAKSRFLATISHELRTPLNAVIGLSQILLNEPFGPVGEPRYRSYHEDINNSGRHLLALINDILDVVKMETAQVELDEENVDVNALVTQCIHFLGPQAEASKVRLVTLLDQSAPEARCDAKRMRQVVLNVLANAVKFSQAGGEVRVTTVAGPEGLNIIVTDGGIGMSAADIARALQPFGQADNSLARRYEGVGIGLPLARHLVDLHGGSLAIESSPGKGTAVTIRLPRVRLRSRRAAA